jgi:hypothetical protein
MQTKKVENQNLGLQAYYKKLDNRERNKLVGYLMYKFGWTYNSVWNRLTGRTEFSEIELTVVSPIIMDGLWKQ